MILYHFTSTLHLPHILSAGMLTTTDSNVIAPWEHGHAPQVVWLLDTPEVRSFDHGLGGSAVDKTAVRFTVETRAIRWTDWEWTHQMDPAWRTALVQAAGGEEAASHWYVFPAPIPRSRWTSVLTPGGELLTHE